MQQEIKSATDMSVAKATIEMKKIISNLILSRMSGTLDQSNSRFVIDSTECFVFSWNEERYRELSRWINPKEAQNKHEENNLFFMSGDDPYEALFYYLLRTGQIMKFCRIDLFSAKYCVHPLWLCAITLIAAREDIPDLPTLFEIDKYRHLFHPLFFKSLNFYRQDKKLDFLDNKIQEIRQRIRFLKSQRDIALEIPKEEGGVLLDLIATEIKQEEEMAKELKDLKLVIGFCENSLQKEFVAYVAKKQKESLEVLLAKAGTVIKEAVLTLGLEEIEHSDLKDKELKHKKLKQKVKQQGCSSSEYEKSKKKMRRWYELGYLEKLLVQPISYYLVERLSKCQPFAEPLQLLLKNYQSEIALLNQSDFALTKLAIRRKVM